jgi:hypothetical protein
MALSVVANARNVIVGIASRSRSSGRAAGRCRPRHDLDATRPGRHLAGCAGATIDHLLFYGAADWLVLRRDAEGYPSRAQLSMAPRWPPLTRIGRGSSGDRLPNRRGGSLPLDIVTSKCRGSGCSETRRRSIDALTLAEAASRHTSVALPPES